MALNRDEPLTEKLIQQTHAILCKGLSAQVFSAETQASGIAINWEGRYRTTHAYAGGTQFTEPERIPGRMAIFVQDFNDDVRNREESGEMDPFYLAADIAQGFVTIHPFSGGNGRMCRLLLNAYLIRYAGTVAPRGCYEEDRAEYLRIAQKASELDMSAIERTQEDEDGSLQEVPMLEEPARRELASFVMEKATASLKRIASKLRN